MFGFDEASPASEFYTADEYLEFDSQAEARFEYLDGRIVAKSTGLRHRESVYPAGGASIDHNQIVTNAVLELGNALRREPCRVFSSDLKIGTTNRRAYLYPDIVVVCGKIEVEPERDDIVRNPIVIIEVLSPSTQAFDKAEKFELYRSIPSLQEYVTVDQKRCHVERYRREGRFWVLETLTDMDDSLELGAVNVKLSIAALYANVQL